MLMEAGRAARRRATKARAPIGIGLNVARDDDCLFEIPWARAGYEGRRLSRGEPAPSPAPPPRAIARAASATRANSPWTTSAHVRESSARGRWMEAHVPPHEQSRVLQLGAPCQCEFYRYFKVVRDDALGVRASKYECGAGGERGVEK
jgi:hypothetical protein